MKKNDEIILEIEDLSADGAGVGKCDGMAFFVKDALVGDKIKAKVMKLKKKSGYAKIIELLEPSPFRTKPKCPLYQKCGGCQIQALSYEKQLEYKERKIRNSLIHIGGFEADQIPMEEMIGMQNPYQYRNKAQFPVGYDKNGNPAAGFYAARTHSIIPVDNCCLGVPQNQEVMERVLMWMKKYKIRPYDEKKWTGLIRHVLIRYGFQSKQLMVCVVIHGKSLPESEKLIQMLSEIKEMTSISISINMQHNNVIMGDTVKTLWGAEYIEDTIGGIKFRISPLSFYQVNPVQTEVLYQKVLEYAQLDGEEVVWDLYCGIGTISLFLAKKAKRVYGVEIVPQAVEDARQNARINGIENAEFFVGKADVVLEQMDEVLEQTGAEIRQAGRLLEETEAGEHDRVPEEAETRLESEEAEADSKEAKKRVPEEAELEKAEGMPGREESCRSRERQIMRPQVVVVDPPRKGCDERLLEMIVKAGPDRVVYVSCDPGTLARDLKYLCGNGYEMTRVAGVDQFCQTVHVEVAVLLTRTDT